MLQNLWEQNLKKLLSTSSLQSKFAIKFQKKSLSNIFLMNQEKESPVRKIGFVFSPTFFRTHQKTDAKR